MADKFKVGADDVEPSAVVDVGAAVKLNPSSSNFLKLYLDSAIFWTKFWRPKNGRHWSQAKVKNLMNVFDYDFFLAKNTKINDKSC